ncbi:MAG: T9SS type A sorting domain-containing protein [FCB group bacterium]|nr:T9SS type A sorting domain-containing protein [FCB group bacterium]
MKHFLISLMILTSALFADDPEIVRFTTVDDLPSQWGGGMAYVNSDGTLFSGRYYFPGAFSWTPDGGTRHLGGGYARGMSDDGVVVGTAAFPMMMGDSLTDVVAAAYHEPDGEAWVIIGPIEEQELFHSGYYSSAWSIAADTMIISGMAWQPNYRTTAFLWTPEDPDGEYLPDYGLEHSSRPNDMSADGSVIVGFASMELEGQYTDRAAHAWFRNDTTGEYDLTFLGALGGYYPEVVGEAYGVSPNGELICGISPNRLFIWSEETGIVELGVMEGYDLLGSGVYPSAITDDGTIVGFARENLSSPMSDAIIYTPESGIIFLKDSLANLGLEDQFADWYFDYAFDITNDGRIIVGTAFGLAGFLTPFILEFIPPTAPTDLMSELYNDEDGSRIELTWTDDPTNNEFSYHLQRRVTIADSTGEWSTLAYPDSAEAMFTDTDVYFANGLEWEYRLRAENPVGNSDWIEVLTYSSTDRIASGLPMAFRITGTYPNPFNPTTTIQYEIPEQMQTKIALYSITGTELAILREGQLSAGNHNLQLDMSSYSSGLYLVGIISGDRMDVQKLTLIK